MTGVQHQQADLVLPDYYIISPQEEKRKKLDMDGKLILAIIINPNIP